jgi:outer membrane protein OmpA-like peptidoglycan-associated protein
MAGLQLGVQADVSTGFAFSQTTYYPTEADRARNNIQEDRTSSFVLGGRLYATVTPLNFLRIYAGGGMDVILEQEGPLPMPLLEIGLHFKPFVPAAEKERQRLLALARAEEERQRLLAEELALAEEERQRLLALERAEERARAIELARATELARQNIQFQADSAELSDSEKLKLQEIAAILREIPGVKIQVEGHTALAGTEGRRVVFSLERAQAVASYLVSLGAVDDSNVTVIGHGAERPIADNDTEEGMSLNRRVEIFILENRGEL